MRWSTLLLAALWSFPAAAFAVECSYPTAPSSVPDGHTASKDEMIAAMTEFKKYNTDVNAYLECLDTETEEKVKEAGDKASTVIQIKSLQTKKHNTAVDELEKMAKKFNDEVRTFKSRS